MKQQQQQQQQQQPVSNGGEERHMNDSTLPPSARAVAPRRATGSRTTATSSSRNKVGLRKGFGLSDWVRLTKVSKDLAQTKGQGLRTISKEEIRQHHTIHDGWISLHGKVYNISPYLHYHPGGIDVFKPCLGRDATALFEKYHRWVNADGLVGVLLLGYLDVNKSSDDDNESGKNYIPKQQMSTDGFAVPAPRPPKVAMPSVLATADNEDKEPEDDLNPWEKSA